jgi:hypothetical protein
VLLAGAQTGNVSEGTPPAGAGTKIYVAPSKRLIVS